MSNDCFCALTRESDRLDVNITEANSTADDATARCHFPGNGKLESLDGSPYKLLGSSERIMM